MLGLLLSAALLGTIISVIEEDEFPGWLVMIACIAATLVPMVILDAVLGPSFYLVALAAGAVCGGLAISAFCGMTVKRAGIAVGIFLAIQLVLSLLLRLAFSSSI